MQKRFVWLRSNVKEESDCKVWLDLPSKQLTIPVQLYFSMRKCQPDMGQFMTVSIRKKYHGFYYCIVMYMSKM